EEGVLAPVRLALERRGGDSNVLEGVSSPGPGLRGGHERDPFRGEHAGQDVAVFEDRPVPLVVDDAPLRPGTPPARYREQVPDVQEIESGGVQIAYGLEIVGWRKAAGRVQEFQVVAPLDRVVRPHVLDAGEDVRVRKENPVLADHSE